jgi:D-3-phosphoglycerate dehydrogenase
MHSAIVRIMSGEKLAVDAVESLILDLLEWVASRERSYDEVMDAWRTSCPRFPVWEDANDRGLVTQQHVNGHRVVKITSSGAALLKHHGRRD